MGFLTPLFAYFAQSGASGFSYLHSACSKERRATIMTTEKIVDNKKEILIILEGTKNNLLKIYKIILHKTKLAAVAVELNLAGVATKEMMTEQHLRLELKPWKRREKKPNIEECQRRAELKCK